MHDETGREVVRAKFRDLVIGASIAALIVGLSSVSGIEQGIAMAGAAGTTGATKFVRPRHRPQCPDNMTAKSGCRPQHHTSGIPAHMKQAALGYSAGYGAAAEHVLDILV
jgi:hypothetical protein